MKLKKWLLATVFVACGIFTHAQQVDYETAKDIATAFLSVRENTQKSNFTVSQQQTIYGKTGNPALFIFNFEGGGFVIVSADKNAEPILAYSLTEKFLQGEANPAATAWVNEYANGISQAVEAKAVPNPEMLNKWTNAEKGYFPAKTQKSVVVEPLLTCKWNQDRYYNALCPDTVQPSWMYAYDDRTPNGCVAVAMAQIMYYHRFPRNGYGNALSYNSANYGWLRADFAKADYNYEAMSDSAAGYSNAIALLCYHAGVSVKMNYAADGSGAYTEDVPKALAGRFNYKSFMTKHDRSGYNDLGWKNLLKTDLNRALPIYYSACSGSGGVHGCHAFVCDGYDDNDFFHFNWGWGGSSNGWFTINSMLGYVIDCKVITGIEPYKENLVSTGTDTLTAVYGSFSDGSSPRANYANKTNRAWLISPQNGRNITKIILKTAYFATEENADLVKIYAGNDASTTAVAVLSGKMDTTIDILASEAFVTFTSNENDVAKGFKFNYFSEKTSDNQCSAYMPIQSEYLTDALGTINSTVEGGKYEDDNTCYWAVKPENAQYVGITFTKFDLAAGDFVEINKWNGKTDLSNVKYFTHKINRFTKENPPVIGQEYGVQDAGAFIRFQTDNHLHGAGFELIYRNFDNWGVNETQAGIEKIAVYPNPTTDRVSVQIETVVPETIQLIINDMFGRTVYASDASTQQQYYKEIDVSSFAKGVYLLKIETSKGVLTRKIVCF